MYARKESPDVLYLVKPSDDNEELKYSLRSLKNLRHGRVFIAGYKPSWVDERVEHIPVKQTEDKKYQNTSNNWRAALNDARLGDQFILMNDDFFIMKPTKRVPTLRRLKNIEHYIELFAKVDPDGYYVKTMKRTRDLLHSWGIKEISSYDLHVPMVFDKQKLIALFDKLPAHPPIRHTRTVYGNYYNIGGRRVHDVKVLNDNDDQDMLYNGQFLSTIDESFQGGKVGDFLRKKFAKVLVFSHANDPDGLLCIILAQLAFAKVDYKLTNNPQADILKYIDSRDISSEYDHVIITDIYPGRPVLEALPNVHWFDHKQNSLDKIKQHNLILPNATVKLEHNGRPTSGSELFYLWLKDNKLISDQPDTFVEYIRQIDTWDYP